MECLISQEDSNLESAQVNFSIASFISGKTTYYWRGSIYCKNPKTYVTHYTVVLNNNMLLCYYFVQMIKNIKLNKKKIKKSVILIFDRNMRLKNSHMPI